MSLTREDFLRAGIRKLPIVPFDCPDLGGQVCIRRLSGRELDLFIADYNRLGGGEGRNPAQVRVKILVAAACDTEGHPLFKPEDAAQLVNMDPALIRPIADFALQFNGLTEDAVGELEGNSRSGDTTGSGSSSQAT